MSESKNVRFGPETWSKGSRGKVRAHATDKALLENVHVWTDGLLGPRPWWQDNSVTLSANITATSKIVAAISDDDVNGNGYTGLLAVSTNEVEFYRSDDNYASSWANNATGVATAHRNSWVSQADRFKYLVGDYLIEMEGSGANITATLADISTVFNASATFGITGSCVHQGRAFYWGSRSLGGGLWARNEIFYSDAYDWVVFASTAQQFQVDGAVAGAVSLGQNLVIWTTHGQWYVLQGRGDPATATLNYVGLQRIPPIFQQPAVMDNQAYFMSSDGGALCVVGPNGHVNDKQFLHLGEGTDPSATSSASDYLDPAASSRFNSLVIPLQGDRNYLSSYEGIWYEEYLSGALYDDKQFTINEETGRNYLIEWNTSTSRWDVYYRPVADTNLDSDLASGSFATGFLETTAAEVHLPRIHESTKQVRVRRVIIDGMTWASSSTTKPNAELTVKVTDGKGGDHTLTLGPASQPLSSVPNTSRTPIRITATPNTVLPYTHFSDVWFDAMQGIAIESVTVEAEVSQGPVS